jgi:hypothetical protein
VLLGGLGDVGSRPLAGEWGQADFLRRVIAAAGPDAFDAVAVHAYHPDPDVAIDRVADIVRTLRTYAGATSDNRPRQQVWITEFGTPAYPNSPRTERLQSEFVRRFVDVMVKDRGRWNIGPLLPYCVRDLKNASEGWHVLGMRRTTPDDLDAGAKPSWNALVRRTAGAELLPLPVLR